MMARATDGPSTPWGHVRWGTLPAVPLPRNLPGRAPILMSPDINWPFWPFPRHSSWGLMSESRHCSPGFGAAFVRIPMEKPPNRHVPRQKTAATRPFLSEPRHCPENKIPPLLPGYHSCTAPASLLHTTRRAAHSLSNTPAAGPSWPSWECKAQLQSIEDITAIGMNAGILYKQSNAQAGMQFQTCTRY